MKWWRRIGIIILLVVVLIIGFLLPTFISDFQDAQRDQTVQTVNATRVQLDMGSALTLLQKLRIAAEDASYVELDAAQNMEADQALETLQRGLNNLFPLDMGDISFTAEGFTEVNHQIILKMSGENSLIYWQYWLSDSDGNQIIASVDDDSGLILSLRYTLTSVPEEERDVSIELTTPLFLHQDFPNEPANIYSGEGLFGGLEEMGSSAEEFAQMLQTQYCARYLRRMGYWLSWETDTSEPVDNSYLYSVMMVDNDGGYYVLPFTVTNNEININ